MVCFGILKLSFQFLLILFEPQHLIVSVSGQSLEFIDVIIEFILSFLKLFPVLPDLSL